MVMGTTTMSREGRLDWRETGISGVSTLLLYLDIQERARKDIDKPTSLKRF